MLLVFATCTMYYLLSNVMFMLLAFFLQGGSQCLPCVSSASFQRRSSKRLRRRTFPLSASMIWTTMKLVNSEYEYIVPVKYCLYVPVSIKVAFYVIVSWSLFQVSWFACQRWGRPFISTSISSQSWTWQFICSPSHAPLWKWNSPSHQISSGMTRSVLKINLVIIMIMSFIITRINNIKYINMNIEHCICLFYTTF